MLLHQILNNISNVFKIIFLSCHDLVYAADSWGSDWAENLLTFLPACSEKMFKNCSVSKLLPLKVGTQHELTGALKIHSTLAWISHLPGSKPEMTAAARRSLAQQLSALGSQQIHRFFPAKRTKSSTKECLLGLSLDKHQHGGKKPSSCPHLPGSHKQAQSDVGLYTHSYMGGEQGEGVEEWHKFHWINGKYGKLIWKVFPVFSKSFN